MQSYRILSKQGEGTFSEVLKAIHLQSHQHYAIKCMKKTFSQSQLNACTEIQVLRKLNGHSHIIHMHEVLYENQRLAIVFELMEINLYELIKDRKSFLSESRVTEWMYQLIDAIHYMHKLHVFHRDVKPENLLIAKDMLKLADLGSSRSFDDDQPFSDYISTRWYRSPECLMTSGFYSHKMDIWATGCVFYELMTLVPLFPGKNELDQINRIHNILGTPSEDILVQFKSLCRKGHMDNVVFPTNKGTGFGRRLSHCSPELVQYVSELLTYDANKRPTASQALVHPFFAKQGLLEQPKASTRRSGVSPSSVDTSSVTPRQPGTPPAKPIVPPLVLTTKPPPQYLNPYGKSCRSKSNLHPKLIDANSSRFRYLSQTHRNSPQPKASHSFLLSSARYYHVK
jgi:renal tumor antigen